MSTGEGGGVFIMNNVGNCPVITNSTKVFDMHIISSLWKAGVYGR